MLKKISVFYTKIAKFINRDMLHLFSTRKKRNFITLQAYDDINGLDMLIPKNE